MGNHLVHTASDQALGFLYQFERVILRLATMPESAVVGIETDDDVTVKLIEGGELSEIFEQDKYSQSSNPFADGKKGIWNTILIWLKISGSKAGKKEFFLVTNQKVKTGTFANKLDRVSSSEGAESLYSDFEKISEKAKGKRKEIIDEIIGYGKESIVELFQNIGVIDSSMIDDDSIRHHVRSSLNLADNPVYSLLYYELNGWVFNRVVDNWKKGESAFIPVREFNEFYTNSLSKFYNQTFIEKAARLINVNQNHRIGYLEALFVEKLRELKISESTIYDAIDDFLRAKWEKTRLIEKNHVSRKDYDDFDDRLKQRWKLIFEKNKLIYSTQGDIVAGASIYYDTIDHKEVLAGTQTIEPYTTRGAYEKLSNKDDIGWHPEWTEE